MNLIKLKQLYEMYITNRNSIERELILKQIKIILAEINKTTEIHIDELTVDRVKDKIKYSLDGEEKHFYFIGNKYYINNLVIELN